MFPTWPTPSHFAGPVLIGTYTPPVVKKGDEVTCLYRGAACLVSSWSSGRIEWPRVRQLGRRGGLGLWVNDELARAIRTESSRALQCWFGVSEHVVSRWRKAFGVAGRATTPGSKAAHRSACVAAGEALKAKQWTDEELDRKSRVAKKHGNRPPPRWTPGRGGWTEEHIALLGTASDAAIALRLERTEFAVKAKRLRLKISAYSRQDGD